MEEITFKPPSSHKSLVNIHNFIVNKLFFITPPCCGEIRLWPNTDIKEKDLDKLETMVNRIKKAKIEANSILEIYELLPAFKYFFDEAIGKENSKEKLGKKYYKIANTLWHILP